MINQLLGQRYEMVEKVGDGPIFAAYKARDAAMNRVVVVKTLNSAFASDSALGAALRPSLEESLSLNHAGITRFYEFRADSGAIYYVSEYVRGIDLKERIRRIAPFTLSLVIDFACAIMEALHYAHSVGQIHGDLRPQNIVISPEGVLKVTGFGIQKAASRSPEAQQAVLPYSAPYHAPELSTTSPGTVAGDIYAVGAMLYEMLTGATLYSASTPDDQADAHAFSDIPSARVINPGVPLPVDGIIQRCVQKKPDQRYASAADLLNDLKSVRDALRFGKPLSWSPPATAQPRTPTPATSPVAPAPVTAPIAPNDVARPVAMIQEKNRLRAQDERVSIYIKIAIGTVSSLILACCIWAYGIYLAHWIVPPAVAVPPIVGQSIEDVRKIAAERKFKLIEHAEFNDKPRGIVYQSDQEKDVKVRAMHSINVWYSRGPEYVNVPNVVNLPREQAEKKLTDAGLKVGRVTPEYSDKAAENVVLSQDVTFKKRVFHDTVVSLTVSSGPNPDGPPAAPNSADAATSAADTNAGTDNTNTTDNGQGETPPDTSAETHTFSKSILINKDGKGRRQVRVEFTDAAGTHPPVIDEGHEEGDRIPIRFDYTGTQITLKVFYNGKLKTEWNLDAEATRKATVQ